MVKGLQQLHARFAKVPDIVRVELEKQIAKEADKIVAELKATAPHKSGDMRDSIGWTWGDAPKGSLKIGRAFGKDYGKVSATIYVGEFYARFLEFGTIKMPASPFFFPVYRASKGQIQTNLRNAVNRAVKKA